MNNTSERFKVLPFLVSMLITMLCGAAGGLITVNAVHTWYPGIRKPGFNPPNWLFGPVWSTLFILIGIAAYMVWRKRQLISRPSLVAWVYTLQLLLNLAWSFLFFYLHQVGAAFAEILLLLAVILWNGWLFYRTDKTAGLLFIPYFLWVSFAAVLTYNIYILNQV